MISAKVVIVDISVPDFENAGLQIGSKQHRSEIDFNEPITDCGTSAQSQE